MYVCLSAEPRLHAAVVSAAKVMRCIQCCLVSCCVVLYEKVFLVLTECTGQKQMRKEDQGGTSGYPGFTSLLKCCVDGRCW